MATVELENETLTNRVPVFKIEPTEGTSNVVINDIRIEDKRTNISLNENALRFLRKKQFTNNIDTNTTAVYDLNDLSYDVVGEVVNDSGVSANKNITINDNTIRSDAYQTAQIDNHKTLTPDQLDMQPFQKTDVQLVGVNSSNEASDHKIELICNNVVGLNLEPSTTYTLNDQLNIQEDDVLIKTAEYVHNSDESKYPPSCLNFVGNSCINSTIEEHIVYYDGYVIFPQDVILAGTTLSTDSIIIPMTAVDRDCVDELCPSLSMVSTDDVKMTYTALTRDSNITGHIWYTPDFKQQSYLKDSQLLNDSGPFVIKDSSIILNNVQEYMLTDCVIIAKQSSQLHLRLHGKQLQAGGSQFICNYSLNWALLSQLKQTDALNRLSQLHDATIELTDTTITLNDTTTTGNVMIYTGNDTMSEMNVDMQVSTCVLSNKYDETLNINTAQQLVSQLDIPEIDYSVVLPYQERFINSPGITLNTPSLDDYTDYNGYYNDKQLMTLKCNADVSEAINDKMSVEFNVYKDVERQNYYGGLLMAGHMSYTGYSRLLKVGYILGGGSVLYNHKAPITVPDDMCYRIDKIGYDSTSGNWLMECSTYKYHPAPFKSDKAVIETKYIPLTQTKPLDESNITLGYLATSDSNFIKPYGEVKYGFVLDEDVIFGRYTQFDSASQLSYSSIITHTELNTQPVSNAYVLAGSTIVSSGVKMSSPITLISGEGNITCMVDEYGVNKSVQCMTGCMIEIDIAPNVLNEFVDTGYVNVSRVVHMRVVVDEPITFEISNNNITISQDKDSSKVEWSDKQKLIVSGPVCLPMSEMIGKRVLTFSLDGSARYILHTSRQLMANEMMVSGRYIGEEVHTRSFIQVSTDVLVKAGSFIASGTRVNMGNTCYTHDFTTLPSHIRITGKNIHPVRLIYDGQAVSLEYGETMDVEMNKLEYMTTIGTEISIQPENDAWYAEYTLDTTLTTSSTYFMPGYELIGTTSISSRFQFKLSPNDKIGAYSKLDIDLHQPATPITTEDYIYWNGQLKNKYAINQHTQYDIPLITSSTDLPDMNSDFIMSLNVVEDEQMSVGWTTQQYAGKLHAVQLQPFTATTITQTACISLNTFGQPIEQDIIKQFNYTYTFPIPQYPNTFSDPELTNDVCDKLNQMYTMSQDTLFRMNDKRIEKQLSVSFINSSDRLSGYRFVISSSDDTYALMKSDGTMFTIAETTDAPDTFTVNKSIDNQTISYTITASDGLNHVVSVVFRDNDVGVVQEYDNTSAIIHYPNSIPITFRQDTYVEEYLANYYSGVDAMLLYTSTNFTKRLTNNMYTLVESSVVLKYSSDIKDGYCRAYKVSDEIVDEGSEEFDYDEYMRHCLLSTCEIEYAPRSYYAGQGCVKLGYITRNGASKSTTRVINFSQPCTMTIYVPEYQRQSSLTLEPIYTQPITTLTTPTMTYTIADQIVKREKRSKITNEFTKVLTNGELYFTTQHIILHPSHLIINYQYSLQTQLDYTISSVGNIPAISSVDKYGDALITYPHINSIWLQQGDIIKAGSVLNDKYCWRDEKIGSDMMIEGENYPCIIKNGSILSSNSIIKPGSIINGNIVNDTIRDMQIDIVIASMLTPGSVVGAGSMIAIYSLINSTKYLYPNQSESATSVINKDSIILNGSMISSADGLKVIVKDKWIVDERMVISDFHFKKVLGKDNKPIPDPDVILNNQTLEEWNIKDLAHTYITSKTVLTTGSYIGKGSVIGSVEYNVDTRVNADMTVDDGCLANGSVIYTNSIVNQIVYTEPTTLSKMVIHTAVITPASQLTINISTPIFITTDLHVLENASISGQLILSGQRFEITASITVGPYAVIKSGSMIQSLKTKTLSTGCILTKQTVDTITQIHPDHLVPVWYGYVETNVETRDITVVKSGSMLNVGSVIKTGSIMNEKDIEQDITLTHTLYLNSGMILAKESRITPGSFIISTLKDNLDKDDLKNVSGPNYYLTHDITITLTTDIPIDKHDYIISPNIICTSSHISPQLDHDYYSHRIPLTVDIMRDHKPSISTVVNVENTFTHFVGRMLVLPPDIADNIRAAENSQIVFTSPLQLTLAPLHKEYDVKLKLCKSVPEYCNHIGNVVLSNSSDFYLDVVKRDVSTECSIIFKPTGQTPLQITDLHIIDETTDELLREYGAYDDLMKDYKYTPTYKLTINHTSTTTLSQMNGSLLFANELNGFIQYFGNPTTYDTTVSYSGKTDDYEIQYNANSLERKMTYKNDECTITATYDSNKSTLKVSGLSYSSWPNTSIRRASINAVVYFEDELRYECTVIRVAGIRRIKYFFDIARIDDRTCVRQQISTYNLNGVLLNTSTKVLTVDNTWIDIDDVESVGVVSWSSNVFYIKGGMRDYTNINNIIPSFANIAKEAPDTTLLEKEVELHLYQSVSISRSDIYQFNSTIQTNNTITCGGNQYYVKRYMSSDKADTLYLLDTSKDESDDVSISRSTGDAENADEMVKTVMKPDMKADVEIPFDITLHIGSKMSLGASEDIVLDESDKVVYRLSDIECETYLSDYKLYITITANQEISTSTSKHQLKPFVYKNGIDIQNQSNMQLTIGTATSKSFITTDGRGLQRNVIDMNDDMCMEMLSGIDKVAITHSYDGKYLSLHLNSIHVIAEMENIFKTSIATHTIPVCKDVVYKFDKLCMFTTAGNTWYRFRFANDSKTLTTADNQIIVPGVKRVKNLNLPIQVGFYKIQTGKKVEDADSIGASNVMMSGTVLYPDDIINNMCTEDFSNMYPKLLTKKNNVYIVSQTGITISSYTKLKHYSDISRQILLIDDPSNYTGRIQLSNPIYLQSFKQESKPFDIIADIIVNTYGGYLVFSSIKSKFNNSFRLNDITYVSELKNYTPTDAIQVGPLSSFTVQSNLSTFRSKYSLSDLKSYTSTDISIDARVGLQSMTSGGRYMYVVSRIGNNSLEDLRTFEQAGSPFDSFKKSIGGGKYNPVRQYEVLSNNSSGRWQNWYQHGAIPLQWRHGEQNDDGSFLSGFHPAVYGYTITGDAMCRWASYNGYSNRGDIGPVWVPRDNKYIIDFNFTSAGLKRYLHERLDTPSWTLNERWARLMNYSESDGYHFQLPSNTESLIDGMCYNSSQRLAMIQWEYWDSDGKHHFAVLLQAYDSTLNNGRLDTIFNQLYNSVNSWTTLCVNEEIYWGRNIRTALWYLLGDAFTLGWQKEMSAVGIWRPNTSYIGVNTNQRHKWLGDMVFIFPYNQTSDDNHTLVYTISRAQSINDSNILVNIPSEIRTYKTHPTTSTYSLTDMTDEIYDTYLNKITATGITNIQPCTYAKLQMYPIPNAVYTVNMLSIDTPNQVSNVFESIGCVEYDYGDNDKLSSSGTMCIPIPTNYNTVLTINPDGTVRRIKKNTDNILIQPGSLVNNEVINVEQMYDETQITGHMIDYDTVDNGSNRIYVEAYQSIEYKDSQQYGILCTNINAQSDNTTSDLHVEHFCNTRLATITFADMSTTISDESVIGPGNYDVVGMYTLGAGQHITLSQTEVHMPVGTKVNISDSEVHGVSYDYHTNKLLIIQDLTSEEWSVGPGSVSVVIQKSSNTITCNSRTYTLDKDCYVNGLSYTEFMNEVGHGLEDEITMDVIYLTMGKHIDGSIQLIVSSPVIPANSFVVAGSIINDERVRDNMYTSNTIIINNYTIICKGSKLSGDMCYEGVKYVAPNTDNNLEYHGFKSSYIGVDLPVDIVVPSCMTLYSSTGQLVLNEGSMVDFSKFKHLQHYIKTNFVPSIIPNDMLIDYTFVNTSATITGSMESVIEQHMCPDYRIQVHLKISMTVDELKLIGYKLNDEQYLLRFYPECDVYYPGVCLFDHLTCKDKLKPINIRVNLTHINTTIGLADYPRYASSTVINNSANNIKYLFSNNMNNLNTTVLTNFMNCYGCVYDINPSSNTPSKSSLVKSDNLVNTMSTYELPRIKEDMQITTSPTMSTFTDDTVQICYRFFIDKSGSEFMRVMLKLCDAKCCSKYFKQLTIGSTIRYYLHMESLKRCIDYMMDGRVADEGISLTRIYAYVDGGEFYVHNASSYIYEPLDDYMRDASPNNSNNKHILLHKSDPGVNDWEYCRNTYTPTLITSSDMLKLFEIIPNGYFKIDILHQYYDNVSTEDQYENSIINHSSSYSYFEYTNYNLNSQNIRQYISYPNGYPLNEALAFADINQTNYQNTVADKFGYQSCTICNNGCCDVGIHSSSNGSNSQSYYHSTGVSSIGHMRVYRQQLNIIPVHITTMLPTYTLGDQIRIVDLNYGTIDFTDTDGNIIQHNTYTCDNQYVDSGMKHVDIRLRCESQDGVSQSFTLTSQIQITTSVRSNEMVIGAGSVLKSGSVVNNYLYLFDTTLSHSISIKSYTNIQEGSTIKDLNGLDMDSADFDVNDLYPTTCVKWFNDDLYEDMNIAFNYIPDKAYITFAIPIVSIDAFEKVSSFVVKVNDISCTYNSLSYSITDMDDKYSKGVVELTNERYINSSFVNTESTALGVGSKIVQGSVVNGQELKSDVVVRYVACLGSQFISGCTINNALITPLDGDSHVVFQYLIGKQSILFAGSYFKPTDDIAAKLGTYIDSGYLTLDDDKYVVKQVFWETPMDITLKTHPEAYTEQDYMITTHSRLQNTTLGITTYHKTLFETISGYTNDTITLQTTKTNIILAGTVFTDGSWLGLCSAGVMSDKYVVPNLLTVMPGSVLKSGSVIVSGSKLNGELLDKDMVLKDDTIISDSTSDNNYYLDTIYLDTTKCVSVDDFVNALNRNIRSDVYSGLRKVDQSVVFKNVVSINYMAPRMLGLYDNNNNLYNIAIDWESWNFRDMSASLKNGHKIYIYSIKNDGKKTLSRVVTVISETGGDIVFEFGGKENLKTTWDLNQYNQTQYFVYQYRHDSAITIDFKDMYEDDIINDALINDVVVENKPFIQVAKSGNTYTYTFQTDIIPVEFTEDDIPNGMNYLNLVKRHQNYGQYIDTNADKMLIHPVKHIIPTDYTQDGEVISYISDYIKAEKYYINFKQNKRSLWRKLGISPILINKQNRPIITLNNNFENIIRFNLYSSFGSIIYYNYLGSYFTETVYTSDWIQFGHRFIDTSNSTPTIYNTNDILTGGLSALHLWNREWKNDKNPDFRVPLTFMLKLSQYEDVERVLNLPANNNNVIHNIDEKNITRDDNGDLVLSVNKIIDINSSEPFYIYVDSKSHYPFEQGVNATLSIDMN